MRTLVLNAGYEPLAVVSFRRALVLVMSGKATQLCASLDPIHTAQGAFERPAVIVLTRYVKISYRSSVPLSRRGVLRRDNNRCVYCGAVARTVDHVLPRSRGGQDTWENLVACCLACNNRKGNRTAVEMGWTMPQKPRAPRGWAWTVRGLENHDPIWADYLPGAA